MSLVERIIRPDVQSLAAYHVPDASSFVKLDAMENPFSLPDDMRAELGRRLANAAINRYPVPSYLGLKEKIRQRLGIPDGFDLVLGNGSDELIAIMSIACARRDGVAPATVLAPVPGFVMYAISARLAGMEFVGVSLQPDFTLDREAMIAAIHRHRPAITYLAYPNNPTGTLFAVDDIVAILDAVGDTGIVVVDEAYQPFASATFMPRLAEFDNLVVMRTVSKLGMAGIRLGYMTGDRSLLAEFDKVRPPYNINVLTETAAEFLLDHADVFDAQAALLCRERQKAAAALAALPGVEVFPSAANFLLLRVNGPDDSADRMFRSLLDRRVLIKNVSKMHPSLKNCLRVTIGTPEENSVFFDALTASLASTTV